MRTKNQKRQAVKAKRGSEQHKEPIAVVEPAPSPPGWSKRATKVEVRSLAERWEYAGQKLEVFDLQRFEQVLTIAENYVALYENPTEPEAEFEARLAVMAAQRMALAKRGTGGTSDQGGN